MTSLVTEAVEKWSRKIRNTKGGEVLDGKNPQCSRHRLSGKIPGTGRSCLNVEFIDTNILVYSHAGQQFGELVIQNPFLQIRSCSNRLEVLSC
jgi:hypothetical protein